jgi:hypothetical protein
MIKPLSPIIKTFVRWLQQNVILAFIAGVILSEGIDVILSKTLQTNTGVLIILVAILVLATITATNRMSESVVLHLKSPPFIGFTAYGEDEVADAFMKTAQRIRNAKKRIILLAGTMPARSNPIQPRMPRTRSKYLETIEEVLEERLADRKTTFFVYKRVLQSQSLPFTETLRTDQADGDVIAHCRKVFQMLSRSKALDKIDFELLIREPSPSCPAILIVDDDFVSLLIISERQELEDGKMVDVAAVRSVITIEDPSGKAANHYSRMIDTLVHSSIKIKSVEN